ncbi:histidase [Heterostelium album PN500]|uniref:Histidine ammonia-lyase n=1 Tax=Heterostelium pallidum (strain ATCC 26659 / Pp 5 / PN500) TaxID=670386 RepID=D3BC51_HETP5|nr:histidase [Heterostelium album PN500]EFA81234.1 histidase [Heterostelium album PN500]|eukprot:XP_020433352.1 histidase [Heterostelium album PN500]
MTFENSNLKRLVDHNMKNGETDLLTVLITNRRLKEENDDLKLKIKQLESELQIFKNNNNSNSSNGVRVSVNDENNSSRSNGNTLQIDDLVNIGYNGYKVALTPEVEEIIQKGRRVIDEIVASNKVVYGINTGFGLFSNVTIPNEQIKISHSTGVGTPLTPARTRMLFALRINVLAKGFSGISLETVRRAVAILNADCLPIVPEKGTVGASGDLAPLSHLALGMMGEGKMYDGATGKVGPAGEILAAYNLTPIDLAAKEGLALINGTQLISSLGAEAVHRSRIIADTANIVAAITLEALCGTVAAFHPAIHNARPHSGQKKVAAFMRSVLHDKNDANGFKSEISESHANCGCVQDSYTLRCIPQVHGIVHDTIDFVEGILSTELNSATDNPMVFPDLNTTMSGGNFHGEYPAKALDYLAIGIHEISNISERRLERLVNHQLSGLPAFLVKEGGLNSGFMISHCTAAALVSENKTLCHPSSVDSLSTSAAKEDHVSMGGWSARKALMVVDNVEHVLAIELLACIQALDFHRPNKTTPPLEAVYQLVRSKVPYMEKDRFIQPDIEACLELIKTGQVLNVVKSFLKN